MQSPILERMKAQMSAKANVIIDYTDAEAMFDKVSGDFNNFDRETHKYFFSTYSKVFEDDIRKAIVRIKDTNNEVLVGAAINKLALKLPKPSVPGYESDYHAEYAKKTISACIWHTMMDTKIVNYKREVKRIDGRWQTITTLFLGGDPVKDITKGIHFKPKKFYQGKSDGGKLKGDLKQLGKQLSSIPFVISDVVDKELLMFGYSLKKDWELRVDKNGRKLPEHFNTKKERYETYADCIVALKEEQFYLELKYSGSGRMFYKCQLEGMRPQGKLWETLVIDSAEYYELSEEQQNALKHHIYCAIEDCRVPVDEAVSKFTEEHFNIAYNCDVFDVDMEDLDDREEDFGTRLLLKKAATALHDARNGKPTNYMFGWDFTTSGLIVAGTSFHSPEMMKGGNIHTGTVVNDAHSNFNEMLQLGLSRSDAKKLHQPLLHGGTLNGLLKQVHEIKKDDSLTLAELSESIERAYGKCVHNIIGLADWGTNVVDNKQTQLRWTLPDGFRASHKAYFQSVHLKVTTVSNCKDHKTGRTSHTIISDMPYCEDNKGKPLVLMSADEFGKPMAAPLKVRGLYANITHSLDSFVLRHIARKFLAYGYPIKLKHDDFAINPAHYDLLIASAKEAIQILAESNLYQAAVDEIAEYSVNDAIAPELLVMDAQVPVAESVCFLMP